MRSFCVVSAMLLCMLSLVLIGHGAAYTDNVVLFVLVFLSAGLMLLSAFVTND